MRHGADLLLFVQLNSFHCALLSSPVLSCPLFYSPLPYLYPFLPSRCNTGQSVPPWMSRQRVSPASAAAKWRIAVDKYNGADSILGSGDESFFFIYDSLSITIELFFFLFILIYSYFFNVIHETTAITPILSNSYFLSAKCRVLRTALTALFLSELLHLVCMRCECGVEGCHLSFDWFFFQSIRKCIFVFDTRHFI